MAELTELGRFVIMRSSVFDVPWYGSVRVGSEMCWVSPKFDKIFDNSLWCSGYLLLVFSWKVDQSISGRLKSPPSRIAWFVGTRAKEVASSPKLVLSETFGR